MLFESERPDFVLFWDKDVNLAKSLENKGVPVFNSARSIALCDDKAKTYLALENKLKQPKTIIAPLSFFDVDYTDIFFGDDDMVIYNESECQIFTTDGVEKYHGSFGKSARLLLPAGGSYKYYLVTDSTIDTIQLK